MREFFGGARSGFFVEVGANHPQFASQTWHLEQLGWRGVLVEPQPDLADNLRRHRTAKVFAVACSSRANAGQQMKLHVAGALSSLERDRMAPGAELRARDRGSDPHPRRCPHRSAGARAARSRLARCRGPRAQGARWLHASRAGGRGSSCWRTTSATSASTALSPRDGYSLIRRVENNGWYVPRDAAVSVTPGATLGDRAQILSRAAIPHPAQCLAPAAPAAQGPPARAVQGRARRPWRRLTAGTDAMHGSHSRVRFGGTNKRPLTPRT